MSTLDASYARLQGASGQDANHGHSHLIALGGNRTSGPIDITPALLAQPGSGWKGDLESETFITAHTLRGEGFDASEDGTGRGTPLVPVACQPIPLDMRQASRGVKMTNNRSDGSSGGAPGTGIGEAGDPAPTISTSHTPAIAFPANLSSTQYASTENLSPSLGAENPTGVAYTTKLHNTQSNNAGKVFEERSTCLDANSPPPALLTAMQVRRLTPEECEALQGFQRSYTAIPYRGKPAADGPRYKALGNSWAVPNVRWIGQRIAAVQALIDAQKVQRSA